MGEHVWQEMDVPAAFNCWIDEKFRQVFLRSPWCVGLGNGSSTNSSSYLTILRSQPKTSGVFSSKTTMVAVKDSKMAKYGEKKKTALVRERKPKQRQKCILNPQKETGLNWSQ